MTAPADNKPAAGQAQADAAANQAKLDAAKAQSEAEEKAEESKRVAVQQAEAERLAKEKAEAAKAAEKSAGGTTILTMLRVLVRRDEQTIVPVYVYEHEMPILEAMHGGDSVKQISREPVEVAGFNPASELERLRRKYKSRDTADVVGMVYRNDPSLLAQKAGVSYSGQSAQKPPRSTVTKGKKRVIGAKK